MECDAWTSSNQPVHLEQKNLFLLALRFYVDMDPLDRDSFWQTAGVFFRPSLLIITTDQKNRYSWSAVHALE
jgi:hypothetical protein